MSISMKQKQSQGYREETCGCQGEGMGGRMKQAGISSCEVLYIEQINNNNFSLTTQQQTPLPVSWPLRTQSIKWPIMTPSSQMLYPCLYHTLHFIIQNFSYSYNTSIIVAISMNHLGQYSLPTN